MEQQPKGSDAGDTDQMEQSDTNERPHMLEIPYTTIVDEVRGYLARGEKLNAIERVKALTGMGTYGAKACVEHIEATNKR